MKENKMHTIGKIGIIFKDEPFNYFDVDDDSVLYEGNLSNLPNDVAEDVAEYDEKCLEYYQNAMMPLYKTYRPKGGSEDPRFAIASKRAKKESDFEYVMIWKIDN